MKKALIVLFVLAVVSGLAFADTPTAKWGAWNQGDLFLYTSVGGGSPTVGWGPTWDNGGSNFPGIDQEWSFSYDGDHYGFSATLEFGGLNGGDTFVGPGSTTWFGAYYKFGDLVKLTLGAPRIDYGTGTLIEGDGTDRLVNGAYSATVEVDPTSNFMVAATAYVPTSTTIANVFNGGTYGGWQGIASAATLDYGNNFGVAAKYTMPNTAWVLLQYTRSNSEASGSSTSDQLNAVVDYTGVKNLEVKGQYVGSHLADGSSVGLLNVGFLSASYNMAPITVAFDSGAGYFNGYADQTGTNLGYAFEVKAEYAVTSMYSVGVMTGYDNGVGMALFDNNCGSWDGFEFWPYVTANFANGSSVKLGLVYASGAAGHQSVLGVPIYYVWSF